MSITYKVEDVSISAVRDRAMFNTFAGNQSYVIANIGQELAVTYSDSSFIVELGTGEAVICGGSMVSEGNSTTLTLGQNQSGYLVIRIDLSQTGDNICKFDNVTSLVQQNINDGSEYIYDLPLYQYSTSANGVSKMTDVRNISASVTESVTKSLSKVATSGSYNDLTNKPTIPTVDSAMSSTSTNPVQNKVVNTQLSGKAPTNHASTATTYGLGTTSNYGHVKLANNVTTSSSTNGLALDAYQGKVLNDKINALDYTGTGATNKTLTKITQTDGKIATTFSNISITKSQVSDFPKLATVATSGSYNDLSNKPTISSGITLTKLWTNSAPTTASETITTSNISASSYKFFIVLLRTSTTDSSVWSTIIPYDTAVKPRIFAGTYVSYPREVTITSTTLTFTRKGGSSGTTEYNAFNIPYIVYGVK